jgi:tRNA(Ile)-lysidine synthase
VNTQEYAKQHKLSIQIAARELRYDFFKSLVVQDQVDYVLTAHHLDDQLETFLINLGRGTGLRGLTGIPAQNDYLLRPLLPFHREEILEYALSRKHTWQEDSSNASNKYVRNDLRHNVIPALKKASPHLMQTFSNTLSHLKDSKTLVDQQMSRFLATTQPSSSRRENPIPLDPLIIPIEKLQQTPHARAYLYEILQGKGFDIDDAMNLLKTTTGKIIHGKKHRLIRDRKSLLLTSKKPYNQVHFKIERFQEQLIVGAMKIHMKMMHTVAPLNAVKELHGLHTLLLDADAVSFPFVLRNWQHGDKMKPLGVNGTKKVSDLLIDHKISILNKEKCLVLENKNDILWLLGIRTSSQFKITTSTKTILKLWFTQ